jgi:hypothetical protein
LRIALREIFLEDDQLLERENTYPNIPKHTLGRFARLNNTSLTTTNINNWTSVHMSPLDKVISDRYDGHSTEHNATIIHCLDSYDSKHGEEADDSLLNHVQDSKSVDGNAQLAEGESSLRQGSLANLSPEYACDTDGV